MTTAAGFTANGRWWAVAVLAVVLVLPGCTAITPAVQNDRVQTHLLAGPARSRSGPADGPVLLVSLPTVGAGLDSRRMAYARRPFELSYFARHEWADTPARMLQPLLVQCLEGEGGLRAVVAGPSNAAADRRLDVEVLALQQEFLSEPSVARVALRAQLVDLASRRVLATETFEATESAPAEGPYGGVVAINRALERVLAPLAHFAAAAGR